MTGEPRVLHVITDTNLGGAGRYLLNLLAQPVFSRELEVWVACPAGELGRRVEELGWQRLAISGRDVSLSLPLVGELLGLIRRLRPHLVHTHASLAGRIAARMAGVPVVYTKHNLVRIPSPDGRVPPPAGPGRRWLNRLSFSLLADRVIAVSDGVRRQLVEAGLPPERVITVPNGIDLRPFSYAAGGRQSDPSRSGLTVGTVARLAPQKGLLYLVRAAALVLKADPGVRFLIGGEGPERQRLQEEIARLGLGAKVHLPGFVEDVPGFLRELDIYVLSSLYEGLPLATLEAMAAALPVVATAVGGVPEAVVAGETGLLVPPGDASALADAILTVLSDRARAIRMGRAGRERVDREFDARLMAERTLSVYRGILS